MPGTCLRLNQGKRNDVRPYCFSREFLIQGTLSILQNHEVDNKLDEVQESCNI